MASQGFWSLGGDNAGANPGSQSPSTREWLFLVVQKKKKMSSEGLIPVHCLIPVLWIWPAVFYNRHICFYTFSLVCSCRNATDLCLVLFTTCMALQLTDLKVGCRSPSFFDLSPLLPARAWCQAAAQKFSGGLGSKLCGMSLPTGRWGWGWDGVELGWVGTCLSPPASTSLFVARVLRNVSLSLFFGRPKALLNVGEVEKPADPAAKQPPQREAAGTCGCNKSCNCTKGPVVFSDLYSTGTRAKRSHNTPDPSH